MSTRLTIVLSATAFNLLFEYALRGLDNVPVQAFVDGSAYRGLVSGSAFVDPGLLGIRWSSVRPVLGCRLMGRRTVSV